MTLEGNRKLILLGMLDLIAGVAVILKTITWDQCMDFWKWTFGIYVAGNGAEHVAKAIIKKNGGAGV